MPLAALKVPFPEDVLHVGLVPSVPSEASGHTETKPFWLAMYA